jgi:hypothetical protein
MQLVYSDTDLANRFLIGFLACSQDVCNNAAFMHAGSSKDFAASDCHASSEGSAHTR